MDFLYKDKHLHFVGIGGVSMSGLARLCRYFGAYVTGSDRQPSPALERLKAEGFDVYAGHNPAYAADCDLLVYTSAVPPQDVERVAAHCEMERGDLLGYIATRFDRVIAVAGTHGKTTVSGMLVSIFRQANVPFCAHVGGTLPGLTNGTYIGGRSVFITEACEYKRHFLCLHPDIGVVTNVEHDHPDCYPDLDAAYDAFGAFGMNCKTVVTTDARLIRTLEHANISTYKHIYIRKCTNEDHAYQLTLGQRIMHLDLNVWGDFNMNNAAYAAATAILAGIDEQDVITGLRAFKSVERRQQYMGTFHGMPVISDYAHHPTEIHAVTKAASEKYGGVAVVYQPHTYSRTRALLHEFATCFVAERLYLLPTFAAREMPDGETDGILFAQITLHNKEYSDWDKTLEQIKKIPRKKYGAILFIGAGNVHEYAKNLVALEQE